MGNEGQLIEELESKVLRLKARELELMKETQSVHDELLLTIGRVQGLREAGMNVVRKP